MKPYLSDADFTLYNGDALETLRELPAESVQMCVTSPPFFGLRDYGTGTWEGGDVGCDHQRGGEPQLHVGSDGKVGKNNTNWDNRHGAYHDVCGKCGARRVDRQIGLEQTPEAWCTSLVAVFEEVRRVLRRDGTLWVECGDSYASMGGKNTAGSSDGEVGRADQAQRRGKVEWEPRDPGDPNAHFRWKLPGGQKPKDLIGQPFLLAFALREAGWYWRNVCIWHKPNPMPESCKDRFTVSHSYVLLFSKSPRYFFDAEAVREPHNPAHLGRYAYDFWREGGKEANGAGRPDGASNTGGAKQPNPAGRNARSVWTIPTEPLPFEHYAAFPQALAERCIKAGTSERGCCPECGAPWVREIENSYEEAGRGNSNEARKGEGSSEGTMAARPYETRMLKTTTTTGWRPGCECRDNPSRVLYPIPCTVLDPFMGSGTTALVARRLNRRCIGIELNPKYCELIARRTQQLSLEAEADLPPAIGMES